LPASVNAASASLNELVSQLADVITRLEAERGEPADHAVLRYVADAVTLEIRHRRRALELARTLTALERQTETGEAPGSRPAAVFAAERRPGRRPDAEEAFCRALLAERIPVRVRCQDGYEIRSAIIRALHPYAVLLETADGLELFMKRNVISIARA
jgi:hypothetical protein